jgi:integrase
MGKLKTTFVLKKYKYNEKLVELHISFGYKEYDLLKQKYYYKPLRYYTGIKVNLSEWDASKKLPRNTKKISELVNIQQTAIDIYNYLIKGESKITPELLKSELDKVIKGRISNEKSVIGIRDYIDNVILIEKKGRNEGTLKNFTKISNKIKDYEDIKKITLTVDNLDQSTYIDLINYVRNRVNRVNSVWTFTKVLKAVLHEISRKYKIDVFDPVNELSKSDKVSQVTDEKPYMNFDHIQTILKYQPKNERLENTKLILITLLFTGCRYSDVFKIRPEHEYNKDGLKFRYTRFIDQKTGKDIIIPLLKPLEDAIKNNNGILPYQISDVKFNKYVKELSELAKLNEEITLSFTNSYGKKEYEVKKFFQFVTSHIGRRSFITNLINYVPVTILSKITGHALTNKNVIFSYNKISLIDNTVLFVKELKRVTKSNPKEFPIKLF